MCGVCVCVVCVCVCVCVCVVILGEDLNIIQQEIAILADCKHPNIVGYAGSYLRLGFRSKSTFHHISARRTYLCMVGGRGWGVYLEECEIHRCKVGGGEETSVKNVFLLFSKSSSFSVSSTYYFQVPLHSFKT